MLTVVYVRNSAHICLMSRDWLFKKDPDLLSLNIAQLIYQLSVAELISHSKVWLYPNCKNKNNIFFLLFKGAMSKMISFTDWCQIITLLTWCQRHLALFGPACLVTNLKRFDSVAQALDDANWCLTSPSPPLNSSPLPSWSRHIFIVP